MKFKRFSFYFVKERKKVKHGIFGKTTHPVGYRVKVLFKNENGMRIFLLSKIITFEELQKSIKAIEDKRLSKKKMFGFIPVKYIVKTPEFRDYMWKQCPEVNLKEIEVSI